MTGLVSVTYRQLSPAEIVSLAVECGLDCVEWGGDIHAPAGDLQTAQNVAKLTKDSRLICPTYGSYFRIGRSDDTEFDKVLESAGELGSDCIRVWAYDKKMSDTSDSELAAVVEQARRICKTAGKLKVCLECHDGTLTDDYNDALKFIDMVGRDNLRMFWQPNQYKSDEYNLSSARALAEFTENVHTFAWKVYDRYPLHEHEKIWREYINIHRAVREDMPFMLEFTPQNAPAELAREARTLKSWLK